MDELFSIYKETIITSMQAMQKIQNELQMSIPIDKINEIIEISSNSLITSWEKGRKVIRTAFAVQNIPDYPTEVLKASIVLDAIVNLFDDLIDEKMAKQLQQLILTDLIRLIGMQYYKKFSDRILERISLFFNKGIVIAISEQTLLLRLSQATTPQSKLHLGIQLYKCRSMDIDIFFEMPLLWKNINFNFNSILKLAREYRTLSLIRKDIADIEHDNLNDSHTPISIICKLYERSKAINYITDLANYSINIAQNTELPFDSTGRKIMSNLLKNIKAEFEQLMQDLAF